MDRARSADSSAFIAILPPAAAAQILGGRVVFAEERKGQWVAVIEMKREESECRSM